MLRHVVVAFSQAKVPILKTRHVPDRVEEFCLCFENRVYELVCLSHDQDEDVLLVDNRHLVEGQVVEVNLVKRSSLFLDRVVLECDKNVSSRSFAWPGLVRRGAVILDRFLVLDCVPFVEGFVGSATVLVFKHRDERDFVAPEHNRSSGLHARVPSSSPLLVSRFGEEEERKEEGVVVRAVLSHRVGADEAAGGLGLLKRLKIFSGSWCRIKAEGCAERLIRVTLWTVDDEIEDDTLYVAASLMLNSFCGGGTRICLREVSGVVLTPCRSVKLPNSAGSAVLASFREQQLFRDDALELAVATEVRLAPVGDLQSGHQLHTVKDQLLTL
jgi:hypothetical protein